VRKPGAFVIVPTRCWSTKEILTKADDIVGARSTLQRLRGQTHCLHAGVAIAVDGEIAWSMVTPPSHDAPPRRVPRCISGRGEELCSSVGAYKLKDAASSCSSESMATISRSWPVLPPLLAELRARGALGHDDGARTCRCC
jgi:septum formation protein